MKQEPKGKISVVIDQKIAVPASAGSQNKYLFRYFHNKEQLLQFISVTHPILSEEDAGLFFEDFLRSLTLLHNSDPWYERYSLPRMYDELFYKLINLESPVESLKSLLIFSLKEYSNQKFSRLVPYYSSSDMGDEIEHKSLLEKQVRFKKDFVERFKKDLFGCPLLDEEDEDMQDDDFFSESPFVETMNDDSSSDLYRFRKRKEVLSDSEDDAASSDDCEKYDDNDSSDEVQIIGTNEEINVLVRMKVSGSLVNTISDSFTIRSHDTAKQLKEKLRKQYSNFTNVVYNATKIRFKFKAPNAKRLVKITNRVPLSSFGIRNGSEIFVELIYDDDEFVAERGFEEVFGEEYISDGFISPPKKKKKTKVDDDFFEHEQLKSKKETKKKVAETQQQAISTKKPILSIPLLVSDTSDDRIKQSLTSANAVFLKFNSRPNKSVSTKNLRKFIAYIEKLGAFFRSSNTVSDSVMEKQIGELKNAVNSLESYIENNFSAEQKMPSLSSSSQPKPTIKTPKSSTHNSLVQRARALINLSSILLFKYKQYVSVCKLSQENGYLLNLSTRIRQLLTHIQNEKSSAQLETYLISLEFDLKALDYYLSTKQKNGQSEFILPGSSLSSQSRKQPGNLKQNHLSTLNDPDVVELPQSYFQSLSSSSSQHKQRAQPQKPKQYPVQTKYTIPDNTGFQHFPIPFVSQKLPVSSLIHRPAPVPVDLRGLPQSQQKRINEFQHQQSILKIQEEQAKVRVAQQKRQEGLINSMAVPVVVPNRLPQSSSHPCHASSAHIRQQQQVGLPSIYYSIQEQEKKERAQQIAFSIQQKRERGDNV